jgi:hypothetical protein
MWYALHRTAQSCPPFRKSNVTSPRRRRRSSRRLQLQLHLEWQAPNKLSLHCIAKANVTSVSNVEDGLINSSDKKADNNRIDDRPHDLRRLCRLQEMDPNMPDPDANHYLTTAPEHLARHQHHG